MIYTVAIATHPHAADPLAALYLVTLEKPVSGKRSAEDRARLAKAVGAGPLADLLQSETAISIRPVNSDSWKVVEENLDHVDRVMIAAIEDERKAQGLSLLELSRRSGVPNGSLNTSVKCHSCPSWLIVRKILAGLGKSLTWLDEEIGKREAR